MPYIIPLVFLLTLSTAFSAEFKYRCLWVVRHAMTSRETVDEVINFATTNRFNHLLVQVRGRGDAYYQSGLVPRSHLIRDQDLDPLDYLIKQAHPRGIKVHAWVNVYLLWSSRVYPYHRDHLLRTHPEWLDTNRRGAVNVKQALESFDGSQNRIEGLYLAPHHPEVNRHLLAVFRELAAKYPLDGIHFDYIRYPDSDYGNNPQAVEHYQHQVGENPLALLSTTADYSSGNPHVYHQLGKWNDYRRQAITRLVKTTKEMLREVNPACILSAAVKPNLYQARDRYFQEWDVWLAAGYLDWAIPMNYTEDLRQFAANIDLIHDRLPAKYRQRVIMGIATYNQSAPDVADKVRYARITRFPGVSFFSYNALVKKPPYFGPLKKVLYP